MALDSVWQHWRDLETTPVRNADTRVGPRNSFPLDLRRPSRETASSGSRFLRWDFRALGIASRKRSIERRKLDVDFCRNVVILTLEVTADERVLHLLQDMGLTHQEAVVYSTLVSLGPSPARRLSEVTHLAREHCYEVLRKLESKGLVDVLLSNHSLYVPAAPRSAVSLFVSGLESQYSVLRESAYEIGAWLETMTPKVPVVVEDEASPEPHIHLVFGKHTFIEFERELEACRSEYLGIIAPQTLDTPRGLKTLESLARTAKRGVSIRIVTDVGPANRQSIVHFSGALNIRTSSVACEGPRFSVFDRSRVMQSMHEPAAKEEETEAICSRNKILVNGLALLFEQFWRDSRPVLPRKAH
jgi:sugar-specific transcriptional regulator TrmB